MEQTVIAKADIRTLNYKGYPEYKFFIVQFEDGTKVLVEQGNIKKGTIKNPNQPSVYGVGFPGQGKYPTRENGKQTREYKLWNRIYERCYAKNRHIHNPTYLNCTVVPRWDCYQNFAEDIHYILGYAQWKRNTIAFAWDIDKDIKYRGNTVYSKDTCIFVPHKENSDESNKRNKLTGLTYIATRTKDNYTEQFINISAFARKYDLNSSCVGKCCRGEQPQHRGWTFKIKEETNQ
jgi:hypothetical protein